MTRALALRLESRLEHVALAGLAARGVAEGVGADPAARDALELCLVEAVTNAVVHAHAGRPDACVEVELAVRGDRIEVAVRDEGPGLDPARLDAPLPGDLLAESGRGMALLRALAVDVGYERGAPRNTLRFAIPLAAVSAARR